jgi:hypothetical protein
MSSEEEATTAALRRIRLLDVIALLEDVPEHGLVRGHVGTVVEPLDTGTFEVEFSDGEGRAFALAALPGDQMLVLHHHPVRAV